MVRGADFLAARRYLVVLKNGTGSGGKLSGE
jgi:hypothetical protein